MLVHATHPAPNVGQALIQRVDVEGPGEGRDKPAAKIMRTEIIGGWRPACGCVARVRAQPVNKTR